MILISLNATLLCIVLCKIVSNIWNLSLTFLWFNIKFILSLIWRKGLEKIWISLVLRGGHDWNIWLLHHKLLVAFCRILLRSSFLELSIRLLWLNFFACIRRVHCGWTQMLLNLIIQVYLINLFSHSSCADLFQFFSVKYPIFIIFLLLHNLAPLCFRWNHHVFLILINTLFLICVNSFTF